MFALIETIHATNLNYINFCKLKIFLLFCENEFATTNILNFTK